MKRLQKISLNMRQKGFTLIELMISMIVGISVLGTVAALFVPSLSTYRNNEAMSSIQENERYSIQTLSQIVDQAGFHGCDSREPGNLVNVSDLPAATLAWVPRLDVPVRIFSPQTNASSVISTAARKVSNAFPVGDVLTLLSSSTRASLLIGHDSANETVSFRGDVVSALDDEIIMLNDCTNSAMFEVASGTYDIPTNTSTFSYNSDDTNNCDADDPVRVLLGANGSGVPNCTDNTRYGEYSFQAGAYATSLLAQSLYIAPSVINNVVSAQNNSLWSIIISSDGSYSQPQQVIFGVDNFRALYGVLGSGGQTIEFRNARQFPAANVDIDGDGIDETIDNVISVKVSLLLSSISQRGDRGVDGQQSFLFPNDLGNETDCGPPGSGNNYLSACPDYMNAAVGGVNLGTRLRRTTSKVFNLRNTTF